MILDELQVNNYVLLNYRNGRKDICSVETINHNDSIAALKLLGTEERINIDSTEKWVMIEGIPFSENFLEQLGFFYNEIYFTDRSQDNGAYVKFMKNGNDIIMKKEGGDWVLIAKQNNFYFECGYISYLHQFQNLVLQYCNINFVIHF